MAWACPEAVCLREQMGAALVGKRIVRVSVLDVTKAGGSWRYGSIDQAPGMFEPTPA